MVSHSLSTSSARCSAAVSSVPGSTNGAMASSNWSIVVLPDCSTLSSCHWRRVTPCSSMMAANRSSMRRSTSFSQNPIGRCVTMPRPYGRCRAESTIHLRVELVETGRACRGHIRSVFEAQLFRVVAQLRELRGGILQVLQRQSERERAEADAGDSQVGEPLKRDGLGVGDHRNLAVDLVESALHLVFVAEAQHEDDVCPGVEDRKSTRLN